MSEGVVRVFVSTQAAAITRWPQTNINFEDFFRDEFEIF